MLPLGLPAEPPPIPSFLQSPLLAELHNALWKYINHNLPAPDPQASLPPAPEAPLTIYFNPAQLKDASTASSGFGEIKLADDGSYLRLYGNNSAPEAYFTLFMGGNMGVTGQYVAIRYRTVTAAEPQFGNIEFFSGTKGTSPSGNKDYAFTPGLIEDGEWHVMVFDLAACLPEMFLPAADGSYSANYLRLDAFGKVMSTDAYLDVAWVGMDPSLDEIKAECQDIDNIQLVTGYAQIELVPTK